MFDRGKGGQRYFVCHFAADVVIIVVKENKGSVTIIMEADAEHDRLSLFNHQ